MRQALSILYFIFYLFLATGAIRSDISDGYPHWFTALEIVFRVIAVTCILFYFMHFRPKALISVRKILPVLLAMFDIFSFFYDVFDSGDNFTNLTITTIICILVASPSWYFCFRYGYLNEIVDDSDCKVKLTRKENLIGKILLCMAAGCLFIMYSPLLYFQFSLPFQPDINIYFWSIVSAIVFLISSSFFIGSTNKKPLLTIGVLLLILFPFVRVYSLVNLLDSNPGKKVIQNFKENKLDDFVSEIMKYSRIYQLSYDSTFGCRINGEGFKRENLEAGISSEVKAILEKNSIDEHKYKEFRDRLKELCCMGFEWKENYVYFKITGQSGIWSDYTTGWLYLKYGELPGGVDRYGGEGFLKLRDKWYLYNSSISYTGDKAFSAPDKRKPSIKLPSQYSVHNDSEISRIIKQYNFFDKHRNEHGDFENNFRTLWRKDGEIVEITNSTGLMWHPSGSDKGIEWVKAKQWVNELNDSGYAGYNDWRLPTVEEAASLLESSKMNNGLYIYYEFNDEQLGIWTGDILDSNSTWAVFFNQGLVKESDIDSKIWVRPVRSNKL